MRKIRVAHVITRLCKGGAQENTFHTVRLANRERYDVALISGPTLGDEGSIEEAVAAAGISVVRAPTLVRNPSPLRDLTALRQLTKLFREHRYDIVHTHTSKAGFLGRMAAKRAGVPILVHTPHGHIFDGYFSKPVTRLFVRMERHVARYTDRIIALTQRGIAEHLAQGIGRPEQYTAVFSGIDIAPFEAAIQRRDLTRQALGVKPDDFLVGAVGRLEPIKGLTYFISAAETIAKAAPSVRFAIVGDGSLREALRDQARGLGRRLEFLGLRDDVPELMAAFDVLVLPSLNEGMGRVLLECGAAGTVAVATDVGGVPEVIDGGVTGVLTPPRDGIAIAGAVIALARDPERRRRMGASARAKIVPNYSVEAMVRNIEALYETLIEEKRIDA